MFFVGALWNFLGGILTLVLTKWAFQQAGINVPDPTAYYYSWIALYMTFGIGYYMIYKDMYANKNIVILGIIGKLAFALIFLVEMLVLEAGIPRPFLIAAVGDLVFVALFVMFLCFARKQGK